MPQPQDIEAKIRAAAAAKNVDPDLALRIAQAESSGRADVKNPRSTAQGLFQVIDDTWKRYGGKPGMKTDVDENIRVGTDILADNTQKLRQMLGRDPQGHEVYAAHFFGPGTAKYVLQAEPDRPLDQILSKAVMNANPTLKGKTTGQFLQEMQGKVGTKPQSQPSVASKPAAEPTASEKMMTDALKSGMSAQNLIKDAGPGYKAAMAMMFLADDKPETPDEDIWKESEPEVVAEETLPSPLASLDLSYQSPFPAPKQPAVQQLAHGGVVHRADGTPESGEVYQEKGMKTEYSDAPKRTAKEMLVYMQAQNPSVRIDKFPMDSNTMGYVSSREPDIVNINPNQSAAREELTKLHELEHSMAFRAGDILGRPNVRSQDNAYRAYHLLNKDWTPIRQFAFNMASNRDKLEKFFGQPMDSGYLNMDAKTLDSIRNRGDALQGLAEEQMASLSALEQTTGKFLTQDPEMRKLFPSTKMMAVYDALTGPRQTRMDARDLPPHTPVPSYMYETNPLMRFIQKHTTGEKEYGIPVKRADGSPMGGENVDHLTPQEIERMAAAQNAAFLTPSSGRGRQAGNISQALNSGEAYPAIARGVMDVPYSIAGGPVDLITMAMRPFGYKEEKPVFGSDWIKEKMTKYGIRPGDEATPTLQGFRTMGELGASAVNPASVVRGTISAAEKTGEAAKMLAKDFQQYNRQLTVPGASYAVKPTGGAYLAQHMDSNMGDYVKNLEKEAARLAGDRPDVAEFLRNKALPYLTKNYGTTNDPIRDAILKGQMGLSGHDSKNFPEALILAANRGDNMAREALEATHDVRTGLTGHVYDLSPNARYIPSDILRQQEAMKMREQGYTGATTPKIYFMGETEAKSAASDPRMADYYFGQLGVSPSYNGTPEGLKYSLANKQPVYDLNQNDYSMLDYMIPENVVAAISSVDPKKLKNSSFADALIQGNNNLYSGLYKPYMKQVDTWYDAVDKGNKEVALQYPKEASLFGMSDPVLTDARGFTWRKVVDPDATRIQSQLMNHSIEGYAYPKAYRHSGSEKLGSSNARVSLLNGDVELYSLYDPNGHIVSNLEYLPKQREIFQARGNGVLTGNAEPVNYADQVFDLVEHLDPTEISNSVKTLLRANNKFAQGGAVERVSGDNRRYL